MWMELAILFGIHAVGGILFGHFEAHTPLWRRLIKIPILAGITALIYATLGRPWSLIWLAVPLAFAIYIHAIWLPRNGINGWTAEPRDKYYELRGWKV